MDMKGAEGPPLAEGSRGGCQGSVEMSGLGGADDFLDSQEISYVFRSDPWLYREIR